MKSQSSSIAYYSGRYNKLLKPIMDNPYHRVSQDIVEKVKPLLGTFVTRETICGIGGYSSNTFYHKIKDRDIPTNRTNGKKKYMLNETTIPLYFKKKLPNNNGDYKSTHFKHWRRNLRFFCETTGKQLKDLTEEEFTILHSPVVCLASYQKASRSGIEILADIDSLVAEGAKALRNIYHNKVKNNNGNKISYHHWSNYINKIVSYRIIDYLRKISIKSRSLLKKEKKKKSVESNLTAKLGKYPEKEELAKGMEISLDQLYDLELESHIKNNPHPFDRLIHKGVKDPEIMDISRLLKDQNALDPLGEVLKKEKGERLWEMVGNLNGKYQQETLRLYYLEELTLKEIGKILNVTEVRVCQIHSEAIKKLKKE